MPSLADYFAKERYQAKYEFGTRVFGKWNKIPFIGTIYGDSVISEEQGPRLTVHLDLPIKFNGTVYSVIIDTHKSFNELSLLVDPEAKKVPLARKAKEADIKPVEKSRSATLLENLKKITK
jgi:hypothetical protein